MRTAFGAKHPKAGSPLPPPRPAARPPHAAQSADNNIIASRCRPSPRCPAARSRCTPIARRALASPPQQAVRIPLAPSRSSPMSRRCPRRWTCLAGSQLFETHRPHREGSAQYIQRIDDPGGAVKAIEQGYIQQEIRFGLACRCCGENERNHVGPPSFRSKENPPKGLAHVDPAVGERPGRETRRSQGAARPQSRDSTRRRSETPRATRPPHAPNLAAVHAYATLGRDMRLLRERISANTAERDVLPRGRPRMERKIRVLVAQTRLHRARPAQRDRAGPAATPCAMEA